MNLQRSIRQSVRIAATAALALGTTSVLAAEGDKYFEVYGFAQLDYIQDFDRVNPDWEDTLRPSRIPVQNPEEFGDGGQASMSVKQSRLGVQSNMPTAKGDLYTKFEFDMFGVGEDAGQTTIRLRHAYGEFGQILAGQTNSLFMDGDIFPNVIDYWGPAGMVFLRNPQIRWTPIKGTNTFAIAIENPSNDIDSGEFRQVDDFPGASGDQKIPDLTSQYRYAGDWGHVQAAGILRLISTELVCDPAVTDPDSISFCPNGLAEVIYDDDDTGWGINLTTVINVLQRDAIRAGVVYGDGIASYMNDGGMDAGPDRGIGQGNVQLEAVPLLGVSAYYDRWWNDEWSSSIGYAFTDVDNTNGQTPDTFNKGEYASVNLLYYPVKDIMVGAELLWGQREDFNGLDNDDTRVQVSFKYNFGKKFEL